MTDTTKTEALPYNPWRESLENCITGDNYLRSAEYDDLIQELDRLYSIVAERDRLAAECEALRADAERYRWLRDEAWGGNNKTGPHLVQYKPGLMPSAVTELAEEAADDRICQEKQGPEDRRGGVIPLEGCRFC